jgi:Imidazoleglycerol-phosphate dehydratase
MRKAHIFRQTKETAIDIDIDLDGSGVYQIETPVGF